MTTRIVRAGNTLMVEIPEELLAQADLPVGEPVEWVSNGKGSITLVSSADAPSARPKRKTLAELLEGIPEGASIGEHDWGPDRGAEIW